MNHLPKAEAELLQRINLGISSEVWSEYHTLIAKRQSETLFPDENTRLIEISDQIERLNVDRVQALIQLANLRGCSLETVMEALGIKPSIYV